MDLHNIFLQNRLTSSLKSITNWPSFTPDSGLVFWQERILFHLLVGAVFFAAILCPPIILVMIEYGIWSTVILYLLLLIWGTTILFVRRLSFFVRAVNTVLILYFLGLGLLVLVGPYSSSYLWMLGFGIMSAVLLGEKAAVLAFALNAMTIIVLGFLLYFGRLAWNSWLNSSLSPWTFLGMTLLFLQAVSSISMIMLIKGFEKKLAAEKETSAALEREKLQLREAHTQLAFQVDKQKAAEAALRQTREYSRNIIDSTLDMIVALDGQHCIVEFNKAAETTYGYGRASIIGLSIMTIWAEEEAIAEVDREISDRGRYSGELLNIRNNGQIFPVFVSASALLDQAGRAIGTLIIARDVTARKQAEDTIRKSEENYRLLFKEMINGSCLLEVLWDENGLTRNYRYLEINPAFERLFGQKAQDLIGKTTRDLPTFAEPDWLENYRLVAESGVPVHFVTFSRHWEKYLEVTVYSPERERLAVIYRDISDRKKAEKALRHSEEKYRALFDHALVGMFRISLDDNLLLEVNDVFVRMFDFISKNQMPVDFNLLDQCAGPGERETLAAALKRPGRIDLTAIRFTRRDRVNFWADFAARVYPEEGYFEGAIIDVTDRHLAEEAQRESETRYSHLFNSISDVIFSHDLGGRIMEITPLAAQKLGYAVTELIDRPISDFMPEHLKHLFQSQYLDRILESGSNEGYFALKAKDGTERYLEYHCTLIEGQNKPPFVSGVGRDVTERVISRREIKKMEERLRQSQKMEAVGTLASGVAHDFNNILQAISGYIQLILKKGWDNGASRRYIEEVDFVVERASDLVQQLLAFGRQVEPQLTPVDLNQEVLNTVKMLERTIPKMINIETKLSPVLRTINGDPTQLKQVIMNLATNARDAMPQGGLLLIETENADLAEKDVQGLQGLPPGAYVLLKVSDTGPGMDNKTREHIFEPFFTTKGLGEGTGLGLSIVYGVIKGHGGDIVCASEPGRGARFYVYLPARSDGLLEAVPEPVAPEETPGGLETILIVDDEHQIIQVLKEILEESGYRTIVADSGERAIEEYTRTERKIDLVILDLGMPGMGGYACLGQLLEINPGVLVIITSGYSAQDQVQGARAFLAKPYRLSDLLKTVRQVLDK